MRRQLLAILTEGAVLKACFIQTHIQKPANEEVGVQPFRKQSSLRTEYSGQHLTLQQLLVWDRGAPTVLYVSAKADNAMQHLVRPPL